MTITLDDETARWASVEAGRGGTSVSRLVTDLIRERMAVDSRYEQARQAYLTEPPGDLSSGSGAYPSRADRYR
ncbi:MAG: hypothetical protein OXC71_09700 [Chloroflexi bacterium]|nr:hypothetical protein [Chloroflexota bacterium]